MQHRGKINADSPLLRAVAVADTPLTHAFRRIEPTWRNYIYYVDLAAKSGDKEMEKVIRSYQALSRREQQTTTPEQVCDLAVVSSGDLVAAVSRELWNHKQSESTISASMDHPRVMEQTALFAITRSDAYKDRELFLRATGTLPDKKGASIIINNSPQTANLNVPTHAGASLFKSMDQSVVDMSKLLDEPIDVDAITLLPDEADGVLEEADYQED